MIAYNVVMEGALNGVHRCCCYIYSVACVYVCVVLVSNRLPCLITSLLYSEVTLSALRTRSRRYYV